MASESERTIGMTLTVMAVKFYNVLLINVSDVKPVTFYGKIRKIFG